MMMTKRLNNVVLSLIVGLASTQAMAESDLDKELAAILDVQAAQNEANMLPSKVSAPTLQNFQTLHQNIRYRYIKTWDGSMLADEDTERDSNAVAEMAQAGEAAQSRVKLK